MSPQRAASRACAPRRRPMRLMTSPNCASPRATTRCRYDARFLYLPRKRVSEAVPARTSLPRSSNKREFRRVLRTRARQQSYIKQKPPARRAWRQHADPTAPARTARQQRPRARATTWRRRSHARSGGNWRYHSPARADAARGRGHGASCACCAQAGVCGARALVRRGRSGAQ